MAGEGVNVGRIFARLGFDFEDRGAEQFERRQTKLKADTARPIRQTVGLDVDEASFRNFDRRAKDLDKAVGGLNQRFTLTRNAIALVKPAALITGFGLLAQAANAAAAGGAALSTSLGQAAGAAPAAAQGMSAVAQAAGVAKLALQGVGDALTAASDAAKGPGKEAFLAYRGGSEEAKKYREELRKLEPVQRDFVRSLVSQLPALDRARAAAMGGLGEAARGAEAAGPTLRRLNPVIRATSEVLGGLAEQAGRLVGGSAFGRDLVRVGESNARVLRSGGRAALDFADAARHVAVEVRPLTEWLGRVSERLAGLVRAESEAARESGRMEAFFDRVRKTLERLGSITQSVAAGMLQVGRAARPLGDDILEAIDRAAQRWEDWAESMRGRNELKRYFDAARPTIFEFGRLISDVTKAFLQMGNTPQTTALIRQLRVELLPVLVELVEQTTAAFGPHLIRALVEMVKLFTTLAGSSGPLVFFVDGIGAAARGMNELLDTFPVLKGAIVSVAATAGIYKALQLGAAITGVGRLISLTRTLGRESAGAAAVGGARQPGTVGRIFGRAAERGSTPANPLFVTMVGGAPGARGAPPVAPVPGRGALGRIGGIVRGAGRIGGALAGVTLGVNLIDSRGNPIQAVANTASDLTFGIVPRVKAKSAGERKSELVVEVGRELDEALRARDTKAIERVQDRIRGLRDEAKKFGDEKLAKQFDDLLKDRSTAGLERIIRNLERFRVSFPRLKAADIVDPNAVAQALGNMNRLRRGMSDSIGDVRESMAFNVRQIGRGLKEGSESWVRALNTNMRAGVRAVELLRKDGVVSAKQGSDEILRIIRTNMQRVARTMDDQSEKGRDGLRRNMQGAREAIKRSIDRGTVDAEEGMRRIRRLLERELKSFGFTTEQARRYSRGQDPLTGKRDEGPGGRARGGWVKRAAGGWIGGRGLVSDDVVPIAPGVMAAYGEYDANGPDGRRAVLNRHQTPFAELALAMGGYPNLDALPPGGQLPFIERAMGALGGLDRLFAAVNRPHMFQRGGIVPIPGEPGESIHSSILQDVLALKRRYRLDITDGYATSGHAPGGEHPKGLAIDAVPGQGGSWDLIDQLNRWARTQLGKVFRWIGYDGVPNHGRGNHIHLSWLGGRNMSGVPAGGAGGAATIPRQRTSAPGMFGGVVQGALDLSRAGANQLLERALASSPGPAGAHPGTVTARGSWSKQRIMALWSQVNRGLGDANLMAAIALAESGGRPSIVNSIGAGGLWQIYPPEPNYLDPVTNARIAGRKLRSQGLQAWEAYTRGMHTQFLQRGGRWADGVQRREIPALVRELWAQVKDELFTRGGPPPVSIGGTSSKHNYAEYQPSGRIAISQAMLQALGRPRGQHYSYALGTLLHEFAHARQEEGLSEREREGGAELWANWIAPSAFRALKIPYVGGQSSYADARRWVKRFRGDRWWREGQFRGDPSERGRIKRALGGWLGLQGGGRVLGRSVGPRVGGGGGTKLTIGSLKKLQGRRIGDFEELQDDAEDLRKRYELQDRKYNQSEEILINEETGQIDEKAIAKRAKELERLGEIRKAILRKLQAMLRVARRVVASYNTILERLRGSLRHARAKDRSGIREQIESYTAERAEWRDTVRGLPFDIEAARLDYSDIRMERGQVLGTKAFTPATEAPEAAEPEGEAEAGPEAAAGLTPDQEAQIARAREIIDVGIAGQIAEAVTRYITTNAQDLGFAPGATRYGAPTIDQRGTSLTNPLAGTTTINQNVYTLVPSDPDTLRKVGDAAAAGLGYQPAVRNVRSVSGI